MNWRNKEDYAYTSSNKLEHWVWEFMRRNSLYIKEWEEEFNKFNEGTSKNCENLEFIKLTDAQSFWNFSDSTKDDFVLDIGRINNWGIVYLVNPSLARPTKLLFRRPTNLNVLLMNEEDKKQLMRMPLNSMVGSLSFDLPLSVQLPMFTKTFLELQKKECKRMRGMQKITKHKSKLWMNYLRCLDAKKEGVERKEAAAIIFSNSSGASDTPERQWSEAMRQAKAMVDSGYKDLMTSVFPYK
jgi:hypothetical protein